MVYTYKVIPQVNEKELRSQIEIQGLRDCVWRNDKRLLIIEFNRELTEEEKQKLDAVVNRFLQKEYIIKRGEIIKIIYNSIPTQEMKSKLMNILDKSYVFVAALDNGNYGLATNILENKKMTGEITENEFWFIQNCINKVLFA